MTVGREADLVMRHVWVLWLMALAPALGCGTTQSQNGTQQLLMSDAIDRSVSRIDFSVLSGKKVYLDDRYVQNIKGLGFINSEYIISALRQQLFAAGCRLQDNAQAAEVIVEPRVGALGTDGHDVTYGLPASKPLSSAAAILPNVPDIPALPELSLARRSDQMGAAKIAVYAYHRESRTPVWQSGTSTAMSDAKNVWILGVGPFQTGTIYKAPRFAGERLRLPWRKKPETPIPDGVIPLQETYTFEDGNSAGSADIDAPQELKVQGSVRTVVHDEETPPKDSDKAGASAASKESPAKPKQR